MSEQAQACSPARPPETEAALPIWSWPGGVFPLPPSEPGAACTWVWVDRLDLYAGSLCFLEGPSGSGKSLFLALISGSVDTAVYAGDALAQQALRQFPPPPRHILVPQRPAMRPALAARSEVLSSWRTWLDLCALQPLPADLEDHIRSLRGAPGRRLSLLAQSLGLSEEQLCRPISTLSGGMQKRLGLALRLPLSAPLLLLDEPDSGVDAATAEAFIAALPQLMKARQAPAILVVSHAQQHRASRLRLDPIDATAARQHLEALTARGQPQLPAPAPPVPARRSLAFWLTGGLLFLRAAWIRHPLHLWRCGMNRIQDWLLVLLAPALILLLIKVSSDWPGGSTFPAIEVANGSKFLFFTIIAMVWLGAQSLSVVALQQHQVEVEEWRWLRAWAGLPTDHAPLLAAKGLLCGSLVYAGLLALIQAAVAAAMMALPLGLWASLGGTQRWNFALALWPTLLLAWMYGALLGLALGQMLAAWSSSISGLLPTCFGLRRSQPRASWVALLLPLVILLHIVASPAFLFAPPTVNGRSALHMLYHPQRGPIAALAQRLPTFLLTAAAELQMAHHMSNPADFAQASDLLAQARDQAEREAGVAARQFATAQQEVQAFTQIPAAWRQLLQGRPMRDAGTLMLVLFLMTLCAKTLALGFSPDIRKE